MHHSWHFTSLSTAPPLREANLLHECPGVVDCPGRSVALLGDGSALSINLAWAYAGLRILHSLWQMNVNTIPVRFAFFGLSSLCLVVLSVRAVMMAL